jgi:Putative Ig domain
VILFTKSLRFIDQNKLLSEPQAVGGVWLRQSREFRGHSAHADAMGFWSDQLEVKTMKSKSVVGFLGLLVWMWLAGCGGGGNTPPSDPLSISTTTLSSGQTSVAYNASLGATGGTAPYTWTIASGDLPAGLTLSTSGTISGTPTSAGLANFTVQVSDSASTPHSTTGKLSLTISGGSLKITSVNPPTGTVGTAYQYQLEASGGVPPYTWALASGSSPLPGGLIVSSSGVVSGTPTASGTFGPQIQVTDSTSSNTVSQNLNFSILVSGTPLANGNYAFLFSGKNPQNNLVEINGVFAVNNGNVSIGYYDENILNQNPVTASGTITNGSASIGSNGLGQLVLTLQSGGNITFALAVPGSIANANSDSDIRLIEFDDTTGKGTRGSGTLKVSNFKGSLSAIKGGYAFGFRGMDVQSQPTALAGSFQADGAGYITGGEADMNDNGTISSFSGITGTYTAEPVGRGVITLHLNGSTTLNFTYYQVSPAEFLAASGDVTSTGIPLVGGSVLQQTGSFTNASLKGVSVLELNGEALEQGTYTPDITVGLLTADGNGNVTATYDEFRSQLLAPQSYSATYTVDADGRTPITASSTTAPIVYLVGNGKCFVVGRDTSASSGMLESQSGSAFTNASFKGNYLGGTIPLADPSLVTLVAADGNGNVQYTSNSSGPSGLKSNQTLTGTYTVGSAGRTVVTVGGDSNQRIFYVVSPTKVAYLSGENGGYLAIFEQ